MGATVFYSEMGDLSLPEEPRREANKYKPITLGEPLCVEICRVAVGNTRDWYGDDEILASSWAKTGGDAKPAPRILNFYRERLKAYESISHLGAEYFGHNLIYYSPAYSGETLRMTLEVLEIDQGGDDIARFVKAVSNKLMGLPFFASQLPVLGALSLVPRIAQIGIDLYNLINRNDVLLKGDLDLSFNRPFQTPLNPGRYVFVYGNVTSRQFIETCRLSNANKLVDAKTKRDVSHKGGMEHPYVVIQVTTGTRPEYEKFEGQSLQQEYLGGIISRLDDKYLEKISGAIGDVVDMAAQGELLANVVRLKRDLDRARTPEKKTVAEKLLSGELAKMKDESLVDALRRVLKMEE